MEDTSSPPVREDTEGGSQPTAKCDFTSNLKVQDGESHQDPPESISNGSLSGHDDDTQTNLTSQTSSQQNATNNAHDENDAESGPEDDYDNSSLDMAKNDPYSFSDGEDNEVSRYPTSLDKDSISAIKAEDQMISSSSSSTAAVAPLPLPPLQTTASAIGDDDDRTPRPDSRSSDLDGDDEDRLVIADDEDNKRDHLNLKENVLNLKSDKPRKKHLRFNGMPEEEVAKKLLPDLILENLDILIIGINPGLYAAFKGHHYAGPGNHFWKCMFLGGLTPKSMCADDDYKLLDHGIGFTNVVMRATRGSANLTRKEIEEGSTLLVEKIKKYKPRIAVFNGKGIYEVFSGQREFHFGKQPEKIEGTETHVWVMPNSSARCAQLPRAVDKVPFYAALKKFRDYLKGEIAELDETEVVFSDIKLKSFHDGSPKFVKMNSEFKVVDTNDDNSSDLSVDVRVDPVTGKKRRGRPPKPRADGTLPPPKRRVVLDENGRPIPRASNPIDPVTGRKKRGRPKKADMLAAQAAFDAEHGGGAFKDLKVVAKRESMDSTDGFLVNPDDKVVEAAAQPPPQNQPVQPLPPFSPNFGRSSALHAATASEGNEALGEMKSDDIVNSGCDPQTEQNVPSSGTNLEADERQRLFNENPAAVHNEQQQQAMQSSPTVQPHHPYASPNFGGSASVAQANGGGSGANGPPGPSPGYKSFSPNYNYASNGSPLHSGFDRMKPTAAVAAAAAVSAQSPMGQQRSNNTGSSDDVTTKSISGLESLVDQIPAVAENDSGVFSGSGAGSHPNTPRSVGPYSPATAGQVGSNFHTSPFHTPTAINHFNNVPSTSDPSVAVSVAASVAAAAAAADNSTNYQHHPPTDFSVNSLVHHHQRPSMPASEMPTSTFADSSFSVSSLTSSYANDMASKYANNPYASSFLGSSAAAASLTPGSFFGQPNSFMGAAAGSMGSAMSPSVAAGMASMGAMSYYGQYSNTYGAGGAAAAAAGFAAHSPYSAYMPNPGYPYSHYGQSPYSQSPYF